MAVTIHTSIASFLTYWLPLLKQTFQLIRLSLIGKDCTVRLLFLWKTILPQVKAAKKSLEATLRKILNWVVYLSSILKIPGLPRPAPGLTLRLILWSNREARAVMSNSQGWFLIFSVLLFGSSVTQIDKTPCHPVNLGGLCDNLREKYFIASRSRCECHIQG